jgi:hypothetical protein
MGGFILEIVSIYTDLLVQENNQLTVHIWGSFGMMDSL